MALSLTQVKTLLRENALSPRKRLGQNFLIDPNYQRILLDEAEVTSDDIVLEIGPGLGNFTVDFVDAAAKVIAVEKDNKFSSIISGELGNSDKLHVVNKDILSFDLKSFLAQHDISDSSVKVFGNLPYYITSDIMELLINNRSVIKEGCFTVQKEVAARFNAQPSTKEYGRLSVFLQFYTEIESVRTIPKKAFYPAPKVDSAFIRVRFYNELPVKVRDESLFFTLVKSAFSTRRKNILNALLNSGFMGLDREKIAEVLAAADIDYTARAETLHLTDFARISDEFSQNSGL